MFEVSSPVCYPNKYHDSLIGVLKLSSFIKLIQTEDFVHVFF